MLAATLLPFASPGFVQETVKEVFRMKEGSPSH